VLRQIRKFNWIDVDFRTYAIKCLASPYSVKFNSIQCLASILSGLSHFYVNKRSQMMIFIDLYFSNRMM
jgi:hypothetical protein